MEGEKFNFLTLPNGNNNAADTMAMMMNNPWMYLVMMAWFANGGMNGGNNRNIEAQLASMQNQINDNNNNAIAREAIQGNGFAISQLAQNLNVDANSIREAINTVNFGIANLGNTTGMGFAGVQNAINLGNLNMIQQMKDCCCATQKQILEQGYQGRIETINQTNDLQTSIRVENGLVRAEVASFRQAWENARYQDVVAEKTRLQTELDLVNLRQAETAAINAAVAPLQAQIQQLTYQMMAAGYKATGTATASNAGA